MGRKGRRGRERSRNTPKQRQLWGSLHVPPFVTPPFYGFALRPCCCRCSSGPRTPTAQARQTERRSKSNPRASRRTTLEPIRPSGEQPLLPSSHRLVSPVSWAQSCREVPREAAPPLEAPRWLKPPLRPPAHPERFSSSPPIWGPPRSAVPREAPLSGGADWLLPASSVALREAPSWPAARLGGSPSRRPGCPALPPAVLR